MTLKIISAVDIVFQGEVESVTLPGALGSFMVLKNHAALVSTLVPGKVSYLDAEGNTSEYEISGGIADIDNNVISVCIY